MVRQLGWVHGSIELHYQSPLASSRNWYTNCFPALNLFYMPVCLQLLVNIDNVQWVSRLYSCLYHILKLYIYQVCSHAFQITCLRRLLACNPSYWSNNRCRAFPTSLHITYLYSFHSQYLRRRYYLLSCSKAFPKLTIS